MSNFSPIPYLSSQSENENNSQDSNLQIDNIENLHVPSQQISCVTEENEMQLYFDKNSKVLGYKL